MAYTTIDDPSVYFQPQLYTGDGASSNAITNGGNSDLQPDWLWIKNRSSSGGTGPNIIFDSTRGVTKDLHTNNNEAEHTNSNTCKSFNTDGFTVGDSGAVNNNTDSFVAWQWKANGGTTTTNDASATSIGSIDSVYQANTTAGFSIVTYTGTGSTATVAHGLGAVPDVLIFKKRSATDNWYVYHKSITNDYYLVLDGTGAKNNDVNIFNDTDPTSTVFSIANAGVHANNETMVCYAFAGKQGYSKFSTFTGNGNADGPFVYTGFKPAWLMIKETVSGGGWGIWDNKRTPTNAMKIRTLANTNGADDTSNDNAIDFLSNGFKMRTSSGGFNQSSTDIVYLAFAESPFVSSKGVPTPAE